MKHAVSRELHTYWDALRAGRTAPERGDIDPAAIRHILAYTFILDVTDGAVPAGRRASFRLSGTRLDALFGRDLRGTGFERIWNGRDAPVVEAVLDGVLEDRVATVAAARGGPPGREAVDLELLLLPLRHHGRTHSRVLGSLAAASMPGWMGLRPAAPLDMAAFRDVSERCGAPCPGDLRPPVPDGPPGVQVGRFRVYQGGRGATPTGGVRSRRHGGEAPSSSGDFNV